MTRLLAVAVWLCGESAGRHTFEPLIADWDRERRDAAGAPLTHRAAIVARGSLAFASTLLACGIRHALTTEPGMKHSLIAFTAAVALAVVSEMAIFSARNPSYFPPDMLLAIAILIAGSAALAAAMLPAVFLLRRDPTTTRSSAIRWVVGGALVAALATLLLPGPDGYQLTADQNERMYQRALANDRAGRYQYPGTVYRQLREPSTPESRRASYARFLAENEQRRADRPVPTPWQRLSRSSTPILAALFGIIGWNLAGVIRPTVTRALVWWGVAWFAMVAMDGRLAMLFRVANFQRLPWWAMPVAAGAAALALIVANRRSRVQEPFELLNS